jgi:hypothetical protein
VTPGVRRITSAGLVALVIAAGCRSSERQAAEAARNSSQVAVTAEQKQLWQDAAEKGDAPGLQRVPVPQDPVRDRERPVIQSKPVPPQPITIPEEVVSQIRIVGSPKGPLGDYKGTATVGEAKEDTIPLTLGSGATLTLLVRAGGKPLPVAKGDVVDVFYKTRQDPDVPDEAIAIRTKSGAGIAHVAQAAPKVVGLTVPLFDVFAQQLEKPGLPVSITALNFKDSATFSDGQIRSLGDLMVMVLGTTSSPFTLNVLVWRNP